jgi:hypothetical protein
VTRVAFLEGKLACFIGSAGWKKQSIPAFRVVDRVGEIFFRAYVNLFSRRWGRLETGVVTGFGQFGGTVFLAKLGHVALAAVSIFTGWRRGCRCHPCGQSYKNRQTREKKGAVEWY